MTRLAIRLLRIMHAAGRKVIRHDMRRRALSLARHSLIFSHMLVVAMRLVRDVVAFRKLVGRGHAFVDLIPDVRARVPCFQQELRFRDLTVCTNYYSFR